MTPTRLLIGQIVIVFSIVLLGIWIATQWAAAQLAYQPQLGLPWFKLFGIPIYRPWSIFPWWYHYDAYAPHIFDKAGLYGLRGGRIRLALACATGAVRHHIRFGTLGKSRRYREGRPIQRRRRVPW